ncbi:adenosylmethionine--8-amino-7-oxononanoate transaminase [Marmoricola sp. URHB0036]|uniref:adenosylmethionine--8-amino-7-oxononanoate transaminase n=1 Tax=Marmoricola sp. URHB0036 TaxID=1298863 RepID=UPI000403DA32|nr:adenosylmethionine--8-amino-7-oxononanoate transaminase [Marmoricola sp. URHB0036]
MGDELLSWDREHLWHPYSSATAPSLVHEVESASGVRLRLKRGGERVEVIDAMSSWWAAIHGYAVPELDAAVRDQVGRMSHVMFGGLTHEPAVELGRRLVELSGLPHVFLADSGSVSVEVAMKMAWQAQAGTGRTRFLTIRGGYHGDTFSPMSVCDPDGGMHSMYAGIVPEHVFAPLPPTEPTDEEGFDAWATEVADLFEWHATGIAAVIVEPLLQGAGGMRPWPARCVDHLSRLAREHGALVIHDEIATGFWRTGTALAQDRLEERADIVCVGKALTGGYLTLAATLCTAEVAQRVSSSPAGAMMHGPTFMGNPLACAVANASLDLLASYDNDTNIRRIESGLRRGLAPAAAAPGVVDVRTLGAVGVVELDSAVDVQKVTERALDHGVWLRPFRNLVYTMPPYVTTDDDLAAITATICEVVA